MWVSELVSWWTITPFTRVWDEFVGGYLIFYLQLMVHYRAVSDVCIGLLHGTGCAPSARRVLFAAPRDMSDLSLSQSVFLIFFVKSLADEVVLVKTPGLRIGFKPKTGAGTEVGACVMGCLLIASLNSG